MCGVLPPLPSTAVPPLFVIEFLHRIMDVFTEYFGECSELKIKDHYVTVYEVGATGCVCACARVCVCVCVCACVCMHAHWPSV